MLAKTCLFRIKKLQFCKFCVHRIVKSCKQSAVYAQRPENIHKRDFFLFACRVAYINVDCRLILSIGRRKFFASVERMNLVTSGGETEDVPDICINLLA